MKKGIAILVCLVVVCFAVTAAWAGGDKVQNAHEQEKGDAQGSAPRPGSDAQDNQSN